MIRILVDSAADYLKEELAEKKIEMVPLTITIDETENYRDELDLSRDDLYKVMMAGEKTVKTSQPSPAEFAEVFERIKENGDELICILLSSTLSGTYQSALLAKNMVDYDKIYVIDSLSATVAIKIMADYALKLIEENYTASDIVEILERLKGKLDIVAAVDTLKFLYLGGRVSRTTAIVADAVNIKPGIIINREGAVEVPGKYFGVNRAVKDLVKQTKGKEFDPTFPLYLIYSENEKNSDKLKAAFEKEGIYPDETHQLGATLGVHVGPGAFGVIGVLK